MGLLNDDEQEQCASDKQALTSQTGSLKCFMFEATFKKKLEKPPIDVESVCIGTDGRKPYAPSASILSCASKCAERGAAAV